LSAVSIANLTIRFDARVLAVDNFSLEIEEGEFVSIVGPSGCGKTSLLNQLTGLLPPQDGSIKILGKAPREGNEDLAYMLARDCLMPWRTALGNALYGMQMRGVPRAVAEPRASELLVKVGLAGFENHWPKALSHGMRQRCALARTFALESPILLMDEPFGALDAQTKLVLEDLLLQLWQEHRRTVIFITHDLAEAVALSDRVVVMSARPGRIVAEVPIALERPRSIRALQRSAEFHDTYSHLWEQLERSIQMSGAATAAREE
jgi:NitT/TauT family transport system ATP-binding protein